MASERELEWLSLFIESGKATECAAMVFPDHSDPMRRGSQLKIHMRAEILKRTQEAFLQDAPMARRNIIDLAKGATQEAVKLKANQDILSRAGLDAAFKVETTDKSNYADLVQAAKEAAKDLDPELAKQLFATDILTEELH